MDDERNVTYITLLGHVELNKYRALYFLIMFTVFILIICFNVTIVCLIWIHKNLHEPMYIFIAALLMNSILLSTNIYPKLLIDFLSEKQIISYSACLFQFFLIYTLSGSEYLLLAAMAYDRYVSICKPLQYHIIMKKTRVSILLVLAWSVSACHVVVTLILITENKLCNFTIKGIFCNNTIYGLQCVQSRVIAIYAVVPLLNLIVLPMLFILFTYTKILIIAYQSCREVRKKALIMTLQKVLYHPLFNPLIYGLKMKEISKHLKRLFCPTKII